MNVLKYRVSLDMFDTHSQTTIKAKKSDSACQIHITLTEKGKIYNIGEGCSATFNARKSDGNFIYDNCTIENNTIVYDFTSSVDENGVCQVSACEGIVECEVTLYNADGKQLTSPRFTLFIDGTVYNGEEIASTPQSDFFEELVAEAIEKKSNVFIGTELSGLSNPNIIGVKDNIRSGDLLNAKVGDMYINTDEHSLYYITATGYTQTSPYIVGYINYRRLDCMNDLEYNPESLNAQSGLAVAQAVAPKMDKFGDVDEISGNQYVSNQFGGFIFQSTSDNAFVGFPLRVVTPNGTEPNHAVNVEYVNNRTKMRLIMEHTVTANEASEKTPFVCTLNPDGKALNLDAIHIEYIIPQDKPLTANTNMSCYLNGGAEVGHCLIYYGVSTGAHGSCWVEAEKMIGDRWRTLRTSLNSNQANRTVYTSYDLEKIDLINQIKISGVYFEGITFKIWGRDAI